MQWALVVCWCSRPTLAWINCRGSVELIRGAFRRKGENTKLQIRSISVRNENFRFPELRRANDGLLAQRKPLSADISLKLSSSMEPSQVQFRSSWADDADTWPGLDLDETANNRADSSSIKLRFVLTESNWNPSRIPDRCTQAGHH